MGKWVIIDGVEGLCECVAFIVKYLNHQIFGDIIAELVF